MGCGHPELRKLGTFSAGHWVLSQPPKLEGREGGMAVGVWDGGLKLLLLKCQPAVSWDLSDPQVPGLGPMLTGWPRILVCPPGVCWWDKVPKHHSCKKGTLVRGL